MSEFFSTAASNERKRQIEELLNKFSQTRDCWKQCLFFLSNTNNEFVMMYILTVLENLINRQWLGFTGDEKCEIRSMLNQYLLQNHRKVPTFIRNKLVKLVVDIGRIDWPHFYPDFFSSILQLIQSSDTTSLGVILLHTASEELAVPREDLSMARKEELSKLLLHQVPTVLNILNNVLETALERNSHLVSATPPPSPTHGESAASSKASSNMLLFSSSPLKSDIFMSELFKSPGGSHSLPEALPPLDSSTQELCALTLNCLSHLFSWVPLSSFITPTLLSTIFHFAGFGCEIKGGRTMNSGANFNSPSSHLGILAMNCINELLSKNCVPAEFEDFLLQMFQRTFFLLQKLTKDSSTCSSGNRLSEIDENYVEKFTDFLRLFVSIHLRRFESNSQFPVIEFLALLFKYTFRQPSNEGFYHCLDIWSTFLDYLFTKAKGRQAEMQAIVLRYKDALMSLVSHVLQKLMFKYNQSQLEELDDDTLDYDEETEWQHFLRHCLELIARVAEILTAETFQILYEPFQEAMQIYFELEKHISSDGSKRRLNIRGENDCRRLHCSLRDLSSLLQGLGRLADHFIAEKFNERFSDGQVFIERLVHMLVYGSRIQLFELTSTEQSVLQTDLIEVHAQTLAAIKPYSHWLAQFYSESASYPEQRQKFTELISTLLDAISCLFEEETPDKISHSATHLLSSLVTTVRPNFLLQVPSFLKLYHEAGQGHYRGCNQEVQFLLYRSLSMYLALPWNCVGEGNQDWAVRAQHHLTFTHQMTAPYFHLKDTSSLINNKAAQDAAKGVISSSLRLLVDWSECVDGEVVKAKQICYQSMEDIVNITLNIFPIFIHQPDVIEDIMTFFLGLFTSFRVQMGVAFTEQTIQIFMGLFSKEQLAETISHESSAAHRVIEKFLKILQIIVQEPGSSFKRFLPSIINICLDYIYPTIAQRPSPDMKCVLYELLHELLLNNWRYFFKGSVLTSLNNRVETVENEEHFTAIMQSYGQSFLQTDIAVFRQNLESLESLNSKWKLYKKPVFYTGMQIQFMNVLLQVLVHKSHDLLQEEIVVTVYNMAAVNFERFYGEFLPQFLSGCEGIVASQKTMLSSNFKLEKDLPTFTQDLQRFINDLRYYRLMNSSLPEGSVQFS
ncbi:exportin-6-like isoform X2 [Mya arenaria]|nr:exportin-6-like isoform X2 [Mya arenaria]XP_052781979.1 exportin-6-like isoform X2 [Mya arenaria]